MLRRILLLSVLGAALLASCTSSPKSPAAASSAESEAEAGPPVTDPNYDNSLNKLVHEEWLFSLPPEWTTHSPLWEKDSSQVIRIISPGKSTLSLHKIDVPLPVNREELKAYALEDLKRQDFKPEESSLPPLPPDKGRGEIDAWEASYRKGRGSLRLEVGEEGIYEWRFHLPVKAHPGDWEVMERIFREAERIPENRSRRLRSSGFFFSSQGGPWRWLSDIGDGVILERLVDEGEALMVCSLFHLESISSPQEWLEKLKNEEWETGRSRVTLQSRTLDALLYSRNPDENTLRLCLIVPDPAEIRDSLCIYMVCTGSPPPSAQEILTDPEIINLFRFHLVIPEGAVKEESL